MYLHLCHFMSLEKDCPTFKNIKNKRNISMYLVSLGEKEVYFEMLNISLHED